jgi:endoglucanase
MAQQPPPAIALNQLGFYPEASRMAVVTGPVKGEAFYLLEAASKDTVYKGRLTRATPSHNSSLVTHKADFTDFKGKGNFVLYVPGSGNSYLFRIADAVNRPLALAVLKGYYFIRSNQPLMPEYAGAWSRPAGHPDTAVIIHPSAASAARPAGTVLSAPGGWYDAGDYNKYVVNSGISTSTLLSAYEDFPAYFDTLKTNIPESNNTIPDILDEALYNLRWMLTMQDPGDGGVYHKLTNAAFDGMVMPGVTKLPRYLVQKSTAAALNLAAVAAQAARLLKKQKLLPALADSCLKAAAKAWKWAEANPAVYYRQSALNAAFDPDITTGEYGDGKLEDEWFWAAAEVYAATKEPVYFKVLQQGLHHAVTLPSWNEVRMLGYYTLLNTKAEPDLQQALKDTLIRMADQYVASREQNAFGVVMGQAPADFIWGSNAVAANQGELLVKAFLLTGNQNYLSGALSNLDYIAGRNATGYSFVTGIGSKPVMHPHHRPSQADGIEAPVPGLLSGGPNPGRQDGCTYPYTEPETAFVDNVCSYASNEIAINWNAPIVYLAHAIEALQTKLKPIR